jgi:TolB-like protein
VNRRSWPLLLFVLSSCGYEVGNLYEIRDVKVDTFENVSERRTQEFDLTDSVVHEIAARGIRVNARDAAYTLKGKILDIRTPSLVDQKNTDQVLVGSLTITLEIRLIDANGTELWKDARTEASSITAQRGETFESALMAGRHTLEALGSKCLAAPVRTRIADNFLDAVVDRHGTGVGLYGEPPAHVTVGHAVAIGVELKPEVLMHQRFNRIAIVIRYDRQWA